MNDDASNGRISRFDVYSLKVDALEGKLGRILRALTNARKYGRITDYTFDNIKLSVDSYYERLQEIFAKENELFDSYEEEDLDVPKSYVANRDAQLADFESLLNQFRDVVNVLVSAEAENAHAVGAGKAKLSELRIELNTLYDEDGPRHDEKLDVLIEKRSQFEFPYTSAESVLDGPQIAALARALNKAFPNPSRLRQLLLARFDKRLVNLSMAGDYISVLFDVVQTANAEGWAIKLLRAARDENPGNKKLREFEKSVRVCDRPGS